MKLFHCRLVVLTIFLFSGSCNPKLAEKKTYRNAITPVYKVFWGSQIKKEMRWAFPPNTQIKGDTLYFRYLDKNNHLHFINFYSAADYASFDLNDIRYAQFPYGMIVQDTSIFILKHDSLVLERYQMNFEQQILGNHKAIDVHQRFGDFLPRFNPMQFLAFNQNSLYIPIAGNSVETNYSDRFLFFRIQTHAQAVIAPDRVIQTPTFYKSGKRHTKRYKLLFLKDNLAACIFGNDDEIILFNPVNGKEVQRKKFNNFSEFRDFDQRKITDLAYIRWYDETSEENIKAFTVGRFIVIIKKLQTQTLYEQHKYEYYVLDETLAIRHFSHIDVQMDDFTLVLPLQHSFAIFSKELDGYHQYEINDTVR